MFFYETIATVSDSKVKNGFVYMQLNENCFVENSPLCTGLIKSSSNDDEKVYQIGLLPFTANILAKEVFTSSGSYEKVVITSCVHNVYEETHMLIVMGAKRAKETDVSLEEAAAWLDANSGDAAIAASTASTTSTASASTININKPDKTKAKRIKSLDDFHIAPGKLVVKATIAYKSTLRAFGHSGEMCKFVLKDETGEVDAIAFSNTARKVHATLMFGKTYVISGIKAKEKKEEYKVAEKHTHEIIFESSFAADLVE